MKKRQLKQYTKEITDLANETTEKLKFHLNQNFRKFANKLLQIRLKYENTEKNDVVVEKVNLRSGEGASQ